MALSPAQVTELHKIYDTRRLENKKRTRERQIEIYEKIPRIEAIQDLISERSLDIAKSISRKPEERVALLNNLRGTLDALRAEKVDLLIKAGYPGDYLEPIYTCSDCQDTGILNNRQCHCYKQATINMAYEQSNVQAIIAKENFDTFTLDYYSDKTTPQIQISPRTQANLVYKYCRKFAETFGSGFDNLILYGQAGLGKTFLCNAIAKEVLDQGKVVLYLTSFQLFRLLETYRFHNNDDDQERVSYEQIEDLYHCDLLIVDDLGSELINQFTTSELFNILNTRILREKPTVISTNLDPSGWSANYSTRIVSRIFGHYTQLKLIGSDIRLQAYR